MKKRAVLSLVIPVYNEQHRINTIPLMVDYLSTLPVTTQLIIVDDGSTDTTHQQLKKLQQKHPFDLLHYDQNRGKGFAIAHGMRYANGSWRGFMDVDLSVPLPTLKKVVNQIQKTTDNTSIIIGTRRQIGSKIGTAQPKSRESMGKVFTQLAQTWLQLPVSDFTCGFKFFKAEAADDIFQRVQIERWSFDPEVLFIAHHRGWKINELPVEWHNDQRTKVKFPEDALRSLHELLTIRYYHATGHYR